MNNVQHDLEQFMKRRAEVARAYVGGETAPLGEMVAHHSPATFFGPQGGSRQSAEAVWSQYERDATAFESGDLAYWVGFQRATAHLRGRPEAVPFNLRVTELFRREGESWKLIHLHADPMISEPEAKQPEAMAAATQQGPGTKSHSGMI